MVKQEDNICFFFHLSNYKLNKHDLNYNEKVHVHYNIHILTPNPMDPQVCLASVVPSFFLVTTFVSSGCSSNKSSKLVFPTFVSMFHDCLGCFLPTIHPFILNLSKIWFGYDFFVWPDNYSVYNVEPHSSD